ncbi:hypothetical protein ACJX0J_038378, partial [Zea mays]
MFMYRAGPHEISKKNSDFILIHVLGSINITPCAAGQNKNTVEAFLGITKFDTSCYTLCFQAGDMINEPAVMPRKSQLKKVKTSCEIIDTSKNRIKTILYPEISIYKSGIYRKTLDNHLYYE